MVFSIFAVIASGLVQNVYININKMRVSGKPYKADERHAVRGEARVKVKEPIICAFTCNLVKCFYFVLQ